MAVKVKGTRIEDLPLTLKADEARSVLRLGRSSFYEQVRLGRIRAVRFGRTLRVARAEIERLLGASNGGNGAGA